MHEDSAAKPVTQQRGLQNANSLYRLLCLPGIGQRSAELLAERFDTWEEFLESDPSAIPERSTLKSRALLRIAKNAAEPNLPTGVVAVSRFDPEWPEWLRFEGAPVLVFIRGSIPPGASVAIVGTRHPSPFGVRAVRACIANIVDMIPTRYTGIVSGLARGIDTLAHVGALEHGLPTWAIIGSGVDVPAPAENIALVERILSAGGGLLSEQIPGTRSYARTLLPRNRLQVAAAERVFIAECGVPSGTLHTARFSVELGRKLIVANPWHPRDRALTSTAGNQVLLNPSGCAPAVLGATGEGVDRISERKPVADASFTVDSDTP